MVDPPRLAARLGSRSSPSVLASAGRDRPHLSRLRTATATAPHQLRDRHRTRLARLCLQGTMPTDQNRSADIDKQFGKPDMNHPKTPIDDSHQTQSETSQNTGASGGRFRRGTSPTICLQSTGEMASKTSESQRRTERVVTVSQTTTTGRPAGFELAIDGECAAPGCGEAPQKGNLDLLLGARVGGMAADYLSSRRESRRLRRE